MPEWAQIALAFMTVAGSVLGSVAAVSFRSGARLTKLESACEANAKAIADLAKVTDDRATKETARTLQAHVERLDRSDAECDGKITGMRQEFDARSERFLNRLAAHEQATGVQNTALTTALAELRATMAGMKESMDRLAEAERARIAISAPERGHDLLSMLTALSQAKPLLKQLLA